MKARIYNNDGAGNYTKEEEESDNVVMVLFPQEVFDQIVAAAKKMSMGHGELISLAVSGFIEKNI